MDMILNYQLSLKKEISDIKVKILRLIWNLVYLLLFRPSPRFLHFWRCTLLRLFGARIEHPCSIYPSSKIWCPWNLSMKKMSCIGDYVKIYNVDMIEIGSFTTISQYSYLCTASHDYLDPSINISPYMPLIKSPIIIGNKVWITTDVFIGPGIKIEDGCVVLARSTVLNDLPAWKIVGGYPAKIIKDRILKKD